MITNWALASLIRRGDFFDTALIWECHGGALGIEQIPAGGAEAKLDEKPLRREEPWSASDYRSGNGQCIAVAWFHSPVASPSR